VADNNAVEGSSIFASSFDDQVRLVNNILVASPGQAAVFCEKAPPPMHFNNVFTPSATPYAGTCPDQTGSHGNISADPLFVDPARQDYYLRLGSPSIDSGDGAAAEIPESDLEGTARIVNGDDDNRAVVDMGALEFRPVGVRLNGRRFRVGDTVKIGFNVLNMSGGPADLYLGVLLPGGHSAVFLVSPGIFTEPVSLATPARFFSRLTAPGMVLATSSFLEFRFASAGLPAGEYVVFAVLTRRASLHDNQIELEDILVADTQTFTFSP
jgi:hypothetical protein